MEYVKEKKLSLKELKDHSPKDRSRKREKEERRGEMD